MSYIGAVYGDQKRRAIVFDIVPGGKLPKDVINVQRQFEEANMKLNVIWPETNDLYCEWLDRLATAAVVGTVSATPDLDKARQELSDWERSLAMTYGPALKTGRMHALARAVIGILAVCLLIGLSMTYYRNGDALGMVSRAGVPGVDPILVRNLAAAFGGSSCGMWLAYAVRRDQLTLDDLTLPVDRYGALTSCFIAGSLAAVVMLGMASGIVVVSVKGLSTEILMSDTNSAALFGVFIGFAERKVADALRKKADSLV